MKNNHRPFVVTVRIPLGGLDHVGNPHDTCKSYWTHRDDLMKGDRVLCEDEDGQVFAREVTEVQRASPKKHQPNRVIIFKA